MEFCKILYDDGEQEILNLAKERWELTGKNKSSAKKVRCLTSLVIVSQVSLFQVGHIRVPLREIQVDIYANYQIHQASLFDSPVCDQDACNWILPSCAEHSNSKLEG